MAKKIFHDLMHQLTQVKIVTKSYLTASELLIGTCHDVKVQI